MTLNMNRLNLPNMVDNQLKEAATTVMPTETYFNPLIVMGQRKRVEPKPVRSPSPRTKITTSLNSIVATVHRQLSSKVRNAPSIPPAIAEIGTEPLTSTQAKVETQVTSVSNINIGDKQAIRSKFNNNLSQLNRPANIPQAKANWEQKNQQRIRRNIGAPNEYNNYTNQQRVREVMRQKRILEDMLEEHQKLQRNRQTIALEIQAMKNYLSEISGKLDFSLKKLNNKKTVSERWTRAKKPLILPTRNRNNNGSRQINNNNNNNNNSNNNNVNKQTTNGSFFLSVGNRQTNNGSAANKPSAQPRNNQRNISLHPSLQANTKKSQPRLQKNLQKPIQKPSQPQPQQPLTPKPTLNG